MSDASQKPPEAPRVGSFRVALRLLRGHASSEVKSILIGLFWIITSAACAVLRPWPIAMVVDSVLDDKPVRPEWVAALGRSFASVFTGEFAEKYGLLSVLVLTVLLLQLLLSALHIASHYVLVAAGLRMVSALRCRVFDHVQRLSLKFHDNTTVGDSLYRVTWDTYCVQSLFNGGLVPLITETVTLIGITVMMLSRDVVASLVALAVGVPLVLLIRRIERPMTERSLSVQERETEISVRVQETLSGIRAVQAFGRENMESARFRSSADASLRASLRLTLFQSVSQALVGLMFATGTAAVVWIGAVRGFRGDMTAGDLVLLVSYVAMIHKPLETLTYAAVEMQKSAAGARRTFALLDAAPEVVDRSSARTLPGPTEGNIRFEKVSFAYREGAAALDEVDLEIPARSSIALVGASGAGKTTLASLVLRFYDPTSGRILLDGNDLKDLSLASLRSQVAIVLQDPILFSSSIRENISFGRPNASALEVEAAAKAAAAHEFILKLEKGYDTPIGERGVNLSGGQRQRLAIARAFLKNAPILIMDEPTSALDAETEDVLMLATRRLMKGRTTLIIAHRLSTIRDVDRIIAMKEGRIQETGTHEELLARGGLYANLYQAQMRKRTRSDQEVVP